MKCSCWRSTNQHSFLWLHFSILAHKSIHARTIYLYSSFQNSCKQTVDNNEKTDIQYVKKCVTTYCSPWISFWELTNKCDPHWESGAINTEVLQDVIFHETQDGQAWSITCMVDLQKDRLKFSSDLESKHLGLYWRSTCSMWSSKTNWSAYSTLGTQSVKCSR